MTARQEELLYEAIDKVTLKMMVELFHGDEIELNEEFTLYMYTDDDIYVIVLTEEWEEILQILINGTEIEFEDLGNM